VNKHADGRGSKHHDRPYLKVLIIQFPIMSHRQIHKTGIVSIESIANKTLLPLNNKIVKFINIHNGLTLLSSVIIMNV